MTDDESSDYRFSRMAVDKAKLCPIRDSDTNPQARVAVVVAIKNNLIGWCSKGLGGQVLKDGEPIDFDVEDKLHAEEALLNQLSGYDLSAASVYVTLEPCTRRRRGESCADLLVNSGVKKIYIANSDPNPSIGALAWRTFFSNNIVVKDFAPELRNEARRDNYRFFDKFATSVKEEDGASIDYESNGGERVLGCKGRDFITRWSNRGPGTIYAIDHNFHVALAKNCTCFEQVDDPGSWFQDSDYTKPVDVGQIVIFRNKVGFALVRITSVSPKTHTTNAQLRFQYQLRYP